MTGVSFDARGAIRRGLFLTACLAVAVVVLALPVYGISGREGLRGLMCAGLLCLVPGWLVFAIQARYGTAAPLAALLSGMLGRMLITLVGAVVLAEVWQELDKQSFGICLGLLYLLSLAVETKLLLAPPAGGIPTKD